LAKRCEEQCVIVCVTHLDDAGIGLQDGLTEAVDVFDDLLVSRRDSHLPGLLEHTQDQRSIALEINLDGHGDICEDCQDLGLDDARSHERGAGREKGVYVPSQGGGLEKLQERPDDIITDR
jgi:hypothetical protein